MATIVGMSPAVNLHWHKRNSNQMANGYRLYTYEDGTTTPRVTYTDHTMTSEHSNPIIIQPDGKVPGEGLFLSSDYTYTLVLEDEKNDPVETVNGVHIVEKGEKGDAGAGAEGTPDFIAKYGDDGIATDSTFKTDEDRNIYQERSATISGTGNVGLSEHATIDGDYNVINGYYNNIKGNYNQQMGQQNIITDASNNQQIGYSHLVVDTSEAIQVGYNNSAINDSYTSLAVGRSINLDDANTVRCFGDQMYIKNVSNKNFFGKYFNIDGNANFDNTFGGDGSRSQFTGQWADENGNYYNEASNYALASDDGHLIYKQFVVPDENLWVLDGNLVKLKTESNVVELNNPDATALNVTGDVVINGNLTQSGSNYETDVETVNVKDSTMLLRDGAVAALPVGEESGIVVSKYDGVNDAHFGVDNSGTFRVGDAEGEVPVAARDESVNLTDGHIVKWDATTETLKDAGKALEDLDLQEVLDNGSVGYSDTDIAMGTNNATTGLPQVQLQMQTTGKSRCFSFDNQPFFFYAYTAGNTTYSRLGLYPYGLYPYHNDGVSKLSLGSVGNRWGSVYQGISNASSLGADANGLLIDTSNDVNLKADGVFIAVDDRIDFDWTQAVDLRQLETIFGTEWWTKVGQYQFTQEAGVSVGSPADYTGRFVVKFTIGNAYSATVTSLKVETFRYTPTTKHAFIDAIALDGIIAAQPWRYVAEDGDLGQQDLDSVLKNGAVGDATEDISIGVNGKPMFIGMDTGATFVRSHENQAVTIVATPTAGATKSYAFSPSGFYAQSTDGARVNLGTSGVPFGTAYFEQLENAAVVGADADGKLIDASATMVKEDSFTISASNQDANFDVAIANPFSNEFVQVYIKDENNKVIEADELYITEDYLTFEFIEALTETLTIVLHGVDKS